MFLNSSDDDFKQNILIVENDEKFLFYIKELIKTMFSNVIIHSAINVEDALKIAENNKIDVVLSEHEFSKLNGFNLCALLKSRKDYIPYFILMTQNNDNEFILEAFNVGVNDFIVKNFSKVIFYTRILSALRISSLFSQKENLIKTDSLTQIPNKKYFNERISQEWSLATRKSHNLSLLIIDIDHFKKINDTYGHDVGDQVICLVVSKIKEKLRKEDVFCRWGGEEFVLILPHIDKAQLKVIAEKIISLFNENELIKEIIKDDYINDVKLRVSIGGITKNADIKNYDELFKIANNNLYKAKESGRNKYIL